MGPGFFKDFQNDKPEAAEEPVMHQFFKDLGNIVNAEGSVTRAMKLSEIGLARQKWLETKSPADRLAYLILDVDSDLTDPLEGSDFTRAAFREYMANELNTEGETLTELLINLIENFQSFKDDEFVWSGE